MSDPEPATVAATVAGDADVTELHLHGTLDAGAAGQVLSAAREAVARNRPIRIVAADISRLDTAGLQILMAVHSAGASAGWPVSLVDVPPGIVDAIDLAGCATVLGLADRTLPH